MLYMVQHPRRVVFLASAIALDGGDGVNVTEVNLMGCGVEQTTGWCLSRNLVELRSLPSLRHLTLPASCAQREVHAEEVDGLKKKNLQPRP
jgi:hypothetical protein